MATHHASDQTDLERALRSTKPFFDKYGTWIIYGVAAILAVVALFVFLNRRSAGLPEASSAIQNAQSASEFQTIADEFPDAVLGMWARLRQADAQLAEGTQEMYTDREAAIARIEDAASAYDRLIKSPSVTPEIRHRALMGNARAAEALCDGDTQPAIDAWNLVLKDNPESFAREYINSRIERLESDAAKRFYTWFSKQTPTPIDPLDLPTDTGPTTAPDLGTVPDTPPDFEITPSTTPDESPTTEGAADIPAPAPSGDPGSDPPPPTPTPTPETPATESPDATPSPADPADGNESGDAEPDSSEPAPAEPASDDESPAGETPAAP